MQGFSGVSTDTEKNFILDAGVAYADIDLEELENGGWTTAIADALPLGATRGGNVFNPARELRDMEIDGALGPVREMQRRGSSRPTLTLNLLEITPENVKMSLAGAIVDDIGEFKRITGGEVTDASYWRNIAIAATLTETNAPVVIVVRNPIVLENPVFELTRMAELVLSVSFVGTAFEFEGSEVLWDSGVVTMDSGVSTFDEAQEFTFLDEPWLIYHPGTA
jgi:hypothetical protein